MHLYTLNEWLTYIASIHKKSIDLGLERVHAVAARLGVYGPGCPVIIVGGTNGKGSTVAALEAIYRAQGYATGCFTTPYLFKHNEQVRLAGKNADDQEFCAAFAKVEAARQGTALTQFEFNTLAALTLFNQHTLDVWILEVGLGGRLDAVNIMDADLAIVTSISIDHTEWLGKTRAAIAGEKAGIFRTGKPAVCGDTDPPRTLIEHAQQIGAPLYLQGQDFRYRENDKWQWECKNPSQVLNDLPCNRLATQNMSTALMGVALLQNRLPVSQDAISKGLNGLTLPGRMQIKSGPVTEIYDVAHNQASVALLARRLQQWPCAGRTHAVFSMLADKEIAVCVNQMREVINEWHVAPVQSERKCPLENLQQIFRVDSIRYVNFYPTIKQAYNTARLNTRPSDRIIVFGSFYTVSEALQS